MRYDTIIHKLFVNFKETKQELTAAGIRIGAMPAE